MPVSFAVLLLKVSGALQVVSRWLEPLFGLVALPGEAALVFVTSCLLNIYSAIAVIQTLGLTGSSVTILALMCLICHNLPVEAAVQKRTGSSLAGIVITRIGMAWAAGFLLSLLLPGAGESAAVTATPAAAVPLLTEIRIWAAGIVPLCIKIVVIITLLTVVQRILEEFGITGWLARVLRWPLRLLGVPGQAAFLWIVANTLGLAYGAGILIRDVEAGTLSPRNADLLNYHIGISHSLVEDTLLFAAIGVPLLWITVPRVLLAGVVVWVKRLGMTLGNAEVKI